MPGYATHHTPRDKFKSRPFRNGLLYPGKRSISEWTTAGALLFHAPLVYGPLPALLTEAEIVRIPICIPRHFRVLKGDNERDHVKKN